MRLQYESSCQKDTQTLTACHSKKHLQFSSVTSFLMGIHRSYNDHWIEITLDSEPFHRPLYQLSTAELVPTKEYIMAFLNKEK